MKTPKEKAEELILKYAQSLCTIDVGIFDAMYFYSADAKQCALIAVDELIKETNSTEWQKVRNELEKL